MKTCPLSQFYFNDYHFALIQGTVVTNLTFFELKSEIFVICLKGELRGNT